MLCSLICAAVVRSSSSIPDSPAIVPSSASTCKSENKKWKNTILNSKNAQLAFLVCLFGIYLLVGSRLFCTDRPSKTLSLPLFWKLVNSRNIRLKTTTKGTNRAWQMSDVWWGMQQQRPESPTVAVTWQTIFLVCWFNTNALRLHPVSGF